MEATGHYWKNLFAVLAAAGHQRRAAQSAAHPSLRRRGPGAHQDRRHRCLGIARFAAAEAPGRHPLPDAAHRGTARTGAACASGCCKTSAIACGNCTAWSISASPNSPATCAPSTASSPALSCTTIRPPLPSAACRSSAWPRLRYDGRHQVGLDLARTLIDAARRSVGHHHSATYRVQVRYACEDLDTLRRRLRDLDRDIDGKLREHEVGRLLTTIDGIGRKPPRASSPNVGDPAHFRSADALAAYVGAIPASNNPANGTAPARASPRSATRSLRAACGCQP